METEKSVLFLLCIVAGVLAQCIDGTLGMAYGISCRTFLRGVCGISGALASAVVHVSEVFTSLTSGLSHLAMKNIDRKTMCKLALSGVLGGMVGALCATNIGAAIEPFICIYLVLMGIRLVYKGVNIHTAKLSFDKRLLIPLGLVGGFLDAVGGGGWGPVVGGTLLSKTQDTSKTIGTVNAAEFFVTVCEVVFFTPILVQHNDVWLILLGVTMGGVVASPLAAYLCKVISPRPMLFLVGIVLIITNIKIFII